MANWGISIKSLRKAAGLTQEQLAERSGLKRSHISNIERGVYKGVKQEVLTKLAKGLSMNTSQLAESIYSGDGQKEKKSIYYIIQEMKNHLKVIEEDLRDTVEGK